MHVEPFLWGVEWNVRAMKADCHEKRVYRVFLDLRDNPIGSLKVGHLVFAVWKSSPIGLGAGEGKFVVRPVLEANVVWSFGSVGLGPELPSGPWAWKVSSIR